MPVDLVAVDGGAQIQARTRAGAVDHPQRQRYCRAVTEFQHPDGAAALLAGRYGQPFDVERLHGYSAAWFCGASVGDG